MAYRLTGVTRPPEEWGALLEGALSCYDTIGDPDYDADRDELLHQRSAFELVRDQLTETQRAELDQVDAHWQSNPEAFNADFAIFHFQEDRATALAGFTEDDRGNVPEIPRDHWWWKPIEAGA